jgi:hypothetical protein
MISYLFASFTFSAYTEAMSETSVSVSGWVTAGDAVIGSVVALPYSAGRILEIAGKAVDGGAVILSGTVTDEHDASFIAHAPRCAFRANSPLYRVA